jgi:hypothetical protein
MVAQVEYSVARRSRGRVMPCAVYTVHEETRSLSFLVEPQNQGRQFISGLTSKPLGQFFWFGLKNTETIFSVSPQPHSTERGSISKQNNKAFIHSVNIAARNVLTSQSPIGALSCLRILLFRWRSDLAACKA